MSGTINVKDYAVPVPTWADQKSERLERLRDEFAMAAMREVGWHSDKDKSARLAYEIADAMLAAREVKP
jgi:hypothetical protein